MKAAEGFGTHKDQRNLGRIPSQGTSMGTELFRFCWVFFLDWKIDLICGKAWGRTANRATREEVVRRVTERKNQKARLTKGEKGEIQKGLIERTDEGRRISSIEI